MADHPTPKYRIVHRAVSKKRVALYYVAAVLIALLIGGILLSTMHVNPFRFYREMLTIGVLNNDFAYKNVEGLIKLFVPLVITSLALSLAFRMKFWNVGGEGQFIMGAIAATLMALLLGDAVPTLLLLLLMAFAGGITAGLYGLITAVLKVRFNTNETLMTLMLNYLALYLLKFLGETSGAWNLFQDVQSNRPRFVALLETAWMPGIPLGKFTLNISFLIAIGIAVIIWVYLNKTKHGYELAVVGDSASTANYAGMKVGRIIIRTVFLSAFLIGVAAAFHVSTSHVLSTSITNSVGWTGVIVAWLSKLSTPAIFLTSILISVLQYGTRAANTNFSTVDANFADLLQGIILFAILIADFLVRFQIVAVKPGTSDHEEVKK